ncbi:RHS repeat-associated core domain-containing protein [Flavobacterium sp. NKUCC04_CG]|nr:RHS repeat-associated core domain-containing protein [Flavobacterium sp. NKUCC04_CG]
MVEQNQSTYYNNGYKFNAKELDAATGMYYYGARYYDPSTSIFLSVDPLAEQFPGWTPYHYVHNNPINLIDPTGMSAESVNGPPKIVVAVTNKVVKAVLSAIVKYDLYGAGGAIMYNGSKGASGDQSLSRKANRNYSPDFWDVSGFIDAASTFGPGGPKVSRKPGSSTSQNAFRNFAAGVEKGKQVESKINSIEALDKASDIVTMKLKEVTFNIFNKDGKTESIEQVSNEVIFTGSAEKVVKQADSLENANISRKERIEKW